ncbi:hypothetical protein B0A48_11525 [Cryoendolithus antarcticus]|uniref:Uncharacterized protein n=1 Tax=Cryoendolithus antarcticus TaxID=1507870 RepID=A0A1V8SW19_9PEZI|nr:hypothetical protein B0A48_11525 [Cryoendolithus antarcticus]
MEEGGVPPPPPPPHGSTPRPPGGLPDGNYDIFIIPPHSSGGGFLYLPSLQPQRNSFIAGILVALAAVGVYVAVVPVLKAWFATVLAGNALGVLILAGIVGLVAWAMGKTAGEGGTTGSGTGGSASGSSQNRYKAGTGPEAHGYAPPPPHPGAHAPPPHAGAGPMPEAGAKSGWEKAREETKRKEDERKRAEDLAAKRAAAQKLRDEADRTAKAQAEKEKWEQARAREKEQRERESRERLAREKLSRDRETRDKDTREREAREKASQSSTDRLAALRAQRDERMRQSSAKTSPATSPNKPYMRPSARSAVGTEDEHSFRPYDTPTPKSKPFHSSAFSISGLSESSYAPSHSTARTTPPPSHRGPYSTLDPAKIILKAVYKTSDSFPNKAIAELIASTGSVSDGLVLKLQSEGLFIDDDVRGVAMREWDVKAWTLKAVEEGKSGDLFVFRATVKDQVHTKYTFLISKAEAWKVEEGVKRLKGGSMVRGLGSSAMKESEVKTVLAGFGWV